MGLLARIPSVGRILCQRHAGGRCIVVACLLVFTACSSVGRHGALPPLPGRVLITMGDFYYDYHSEEFTTGRFIVEVYNTGTLGHELVMFALPEDLPPIGEQLSGGQRRVLDPVAVIGNRQPGETGTFAFDLVPNQRYAFVCFLYDDGQHFRKGMSSEFRTPASPAGS